MIRLLSRFSVLPWHKLSKLRGRPVPLETNSAGAENTNAVLHSGRVAVRFAPEPNGHLHIGHIKAIRLNFQAAKQNGGVCYLRYDDTNPTNERPEFEESIHKTVTWLGYNPFKITRASQYQPQLISFAQRLLRQGDAYMCDSIGQQLAEERRQKRASLHRQIPFALQVERFQAMCKGQGKFVLRMKLDPGSPNPTLRDPVIYRVKQGRPRALYDFAHPICDSLEGISHSLCTLEFQIRRELYFTVLDKLSLYKPVVWEYSRLNVSESPVSKRKIAALIKEGSLEGWDDPRLLTLPALLRLGYSPNCLFQFIDQTGYSRNGNQNVVMKAHLQNLLRAELDATAPRTMAVVDPVPLHLEGARVAVSQPLYPKSPQKGSCMLSSEGQLFIQLQDVKGGQIKQPIKEGQTVLLKYLGPVLIKKISEQGVYCQRVQVQKTPKKVIHWIALSQAVQTTVLEYGALNEAKKQRKCLVRKGIEGVWQFQRNGYYKKEGGAWLRVIKLRS